MAEPAKGLSPTDEENRKLQRLERQGEGKGKAWAVRRALAVLASAAGNTVPVIASLASPSELRWGPALRPAPHGSRARN